MPEIAPAIPLLPAAQPTTTGPAPVAPTAPTDATPDFLGQLTAALKSLAGALPVLPVADPMVEQTPVAADKPATQKSTDKPTDEVMEILASLGITLTTPTFLAPAATETPTTSVSQPPVAASLVQPLLTATIAPTKAETVTAAPVEVAPISDHKTDAVTSPKVSTTVHSASATPVDQSVSTKLESLRTAVTPDVVAQPQTLHAAAPEPVVIPTVGAVQTHVPTGGGGGAGAGFQSHTGNDDTHHEHSASTTSRIVETTESTDTATAPVVDQAQAPIASTLAAPQPANVEPTHVVSQIAHQAELYRLPGNRGVRIQLHPDDLGGVQVTLRYAAGGTMELHINVEHAATGALVEAGWTQLRDALATQGINPDRMVMSITGPSSANQLDMSSNGQGSNRPDPGLTSFSQDSQSGSQRDNSGDDARQSRGWSSAADQLSPQSSSRDATAAASSRIDYRV